jgi:hypothetical protein
VLPG